MKARRRTLAWVGEMKCGDLLVRLLTDAQLAKSRAQTETKAAQAETKANVIVMPRCSALILYWSGDSVLPRLRERS
jgi:hypothetical protein